MEAFVRRAADGTFEADLFELDGIPPKDPPRVRGQPSAYVAARELVLAFSNSSQHADLWLEPIPPALNARLHFYGCNTAIESCAVSTSNGGSVN